MYSLHNLTYVFLTLAALCVAYFVQQFLTQDEEHPSKSRIVFVLPFVVTPAMSAAAWFTGAAVSTKVIDKTIDKII